MKLCAIGWIGTGLLALGFLGCANVSKDNSRILVNVAGEKITQFQFEQVVKVLVGDPQKAQELLTSKAMVEHRNQLLDSMALQKAIIQMAKAQGLEKDVQIGFALEQSTAQLFLKALMERRVLNSTEKLEPTEPELRALYDQGIEQSKAAGQTKDLPTFEMVKPQLTAGWLQKKRQEKNEIEFKALIAEMRKSYPITYADGYKPTPQPGQP